MSASLVGLDPLFVTNVKLQIREILQLELKNDELIGIYKLYSHSIKFVDICGVVVAVDRHSNFTLITVDDGTEKIDCCLWPEIGKDFVYENGMLVRVLGKISEIRNSRQIAIYDIFVKNDPNYENFHFIQCEKLKQEYKKPFELPPAIELEKERILSMIGDSDHTEEETNVPDPKDTFRKELLNKLSQIPNTPFVIEEWFGSDDLKEVLMLSGMETEQPKKDIQDLIITSFQSMAKNGSIVEMDTNDGRFLYVDDDKLKQVICNVILKMSRIAEERNNYNGVMLDYILYEVKRTKDLKALPTRKIKRMLNELVEHSRIYPTGKEQYKVVE